MAAVGEAGAGKAEKEMVAAGLESAASAVEVDVVVVTAAERVAREVSRAAVEVENPPKALAGAVPMWRSSIGAAARSDHGQPPRRRRVPYRRAQRHTCTRSSGTTDFALQVLH